jgi:hypothetical protein
MKIKILKTISIAALPTEFRKAMEEALAHMPEFMGGVSQIIQASPLLFTAEDGEVNKEAVEYFKGLLEQQRGVLYNIDSILDDWSFIIGDLGTLPIEGANQDDNIQQKEEE